MLNGAQRVGISLADDDLPPLLLGIELLLEARLQPGREVRALRVGVVGEQDCLSGRDVCEYLVLERVSYGQLRDNLHETSRQ